MTPIRVVCHQLAPRLGDADDNRRLSETAIRGAASLGAHVVVLPELMQSGYAFNDLAEARAVSEPLDGPTLSLWRTLAIELGLIVVAGFCERLSAGQVANSAALIEPDGRLTVYRKAHLWDREKLIFTAGTAPPPLVETAVGRIGVVICYDLELPEWVRLAALAGTDLLCAPVNWPDSPRPAAERPGEIVRVQANAAVNRMFIAACDRYGEERGVNWVGGSVIVDADGYPLAGGVSHQQEQRLVADLPLLQARNKHISEHNHVHLDRRPGLY
ncbi:carbon-nitrogen hydrolase [Pseudomonas veronii]|jgi:predicted amidohydrolase|uniref:Carbon-nitrogen hydrolase n=1 Tax=Pseudomonas veronii TaxID=76761 RepID=A0A7Y1F114_PSEVE|nr:nitrilase-related carbon-nitrogen hydrolase [Pseudomonas veronii]SEB54314.1 Predicted amidohydrolase [Pseudomonas marginalis]KRP81751.1 carbon-nitrogen hydrolase [Pseudomonas veronii]MCT8962389.1 carbon-nitrogen hydrolase [Pseudomonas veronii]NMX40488.1 carbon-nitrogen hydrolase [Pseudomonas veronii]NMX95377.1 carbon-nitrogen hydrolase [Pseudomonas veronii]